MPTVNEYNGRQTLQVELKAMRPAAVPEAERYLAARREKFIDAICANIRYNKMRAEQAFFVAEPENFLLAHTARDIAGLLVLCFTPAGAARFCAWLLSGGCMAAWRSASAKCG